MLPLAGQCNVSATNRAPYDYELFVFTAPKTDHLVIAVTFIQDSGRLMRWRDPEFEVRLHANRQNWAISGPRPQSGVISQSLNVRAFAGRIVGRDACVPAKYNAVVLEGPLDLLCKGESLQVWAEILDEDGSRFRVGHPFTAEILAREPVLSRMFHAASPDQDRFLFSDAFAERMAVVAAAEGSIADPEAHGRRLASLLLPDVISYRPDFPTGFTFAGRNGRHPADDTAAIVRTVLNGVVTQPAAEMPFPAVQGISVFLVASYFGLVSMRGFVMSHHFDTPTAQEDPRINVCDFYLFRGRPGTTVMALTVNPNAGISAPGYLPRRGALRFPFRSQWRCPGGSNLQSSVR